MIFFFECAGTLFSIWYLILITRMSSAAWYPYIISGVCYLPVFYASQLYADSALQIFYIGLGFWALRAWQGRSETLPALELSKTYQIYTLSVVCCGSLLVGKALTYTDAGVYAYPDAAIAVMSIVASFLTSNRYRQGWPYWIIVNVLAVLTFAHRALFLGGVGVVTVGLYAIYLVLSVRANREWRRVPQN